MASATLALVGAVNVVAAASFTAVAMRLAHHWSDPIDRLAQRAIAMWWGSMAVVVGVHGFLTVAAAAGNVDIGAQTVARYLNGLLLGVAGWGLTYHVLYLFTGRRAWAIAVAPYFVATGLAYWATILRHPIASIEPTWYQVAIAYEPPLEADPLWDIVVAMVGLPLIAGGIGYLSVLPRIHNADARRRATLSAAAILVWVGSGLVTEMVGGPLADFMVYTVLGLVAAGLALRAYFPWQRPQAAVQPAPASP